MIFTVNLNFALEKELVIPNFATGHEFRPEKVATFAGGKGVNVYRVLHALKEKALLFGLVGGTTGKVIENLLQQELGNFHLISATQESRSIFSIIDPINNQVTEIYELGSRFETTLEKAIIENYTTLIKKACMVVIAGSLPNGLSPSLYADLIKIAQRNDVPQIVDTSGEALMHAIKQNPTFLQCNKKEAASLLHFEVNAENSEKTLKQLAQKTKGSIILTLSENGLIATHEQVIYHVKNNAGKGKYPVGSGNAFSAGFTHGWKQKWSFEKTLQFACACATTHAMTEGVGKIDVTKIDTVLPSIQVIHS